MIWLDLKQGAGHPDHKQWLAGQKSWIRHSKLVVLSPSKIRVTTGWNLVSHHGKEGCLSVVYSFLTASA